MAEGQPQKRRLKRYRSVSITKGADLRASRSLIGGIIAALMTVAGLIPTSSQAVDRATVPRTAPPIEAYEPTILGYTKQSDDVSFADIQISLKYQLLRKTMWGWFNPTEKKEKAKDGIDYDPDTDRQRLYLTFTGRFGFYVRTRRSSPVIAKNYNPKLLWRWIPRPGIKKNADATKETQKQEYSGYIDFAYAHDSNGQTIDTAEAYALAQHTLEEPGFALDQVSRGWDYAQVEAKKSFDPNGDGSSELSAYAGFKFFLRHGILQGVPEEYRSFEGDPTARPRHAYDGLMIAGEYRPTLRWVANPRFYLQYKTGYEPIARFNTIRGEFGFVLFELPITAYVQDGYMNSLARYYKKARAVGLELRIAE